MLKQRQIAEHLDMSQQAVSAMLDKLGLDWRKESLQTIRVAYLRHLRGVAAGHQSSSGEDLTLERIKTERVERELKELQLAEKRGALINAHQLDPAMLQMVSAFRTELLARDDKLATDLKLLYGLQVDVAILNEFSYAAIGQFGRYCPVRHSLHLE